MASTPRREFEGNDLPPTPRSSSYKRQYYDDSGRKTESWYDHIPKSPLRHKNSLREDFMTEASKAAKKLAIPERNKLSGFDYRVFTRPSKASERIRLKAKKHRNNILCCPTPHSISSTPCVSGRGFVAPTRISPRYYVVTGVKLDGPKEEKSYQVREGEKLHWVPASKVMKQSIKEYLRRENAFE